MSPFEILLFNDIMEKGSFQVFDSFQDYLLKTVFTSNPMWPLPPSSDTSTSSLASSEEGAEFLFGLEKSRKERRKVKRELRKNTKANRGLCKVKERLQIIKEEEECGFCFEFGWDEEDEEVFGRDDNDDGNESGDSGSCCGDSDDGSSMDIHEGMDDEAGSEEDSDEEIEDCWRRPRKIVRWKEDHELEEIMILKQEEIYIFGQQRVISKEDDTKTIDPRILDLPRVLTKEPTSAPTEEANLIELTAVAESWILNAQRIPSPETRVGIDPAIQHYTKSISALKAVEEAHSEEKLSHDELFHLNLMQKVSASRISCLEAVFAGKLTLLRNTAATAHCADKYSMTGCTAQCSKDRVRWIWLEDINVDEVDRENEKRRKIRFSEQDDVLVIPARDISDYDHEARMSAFWKKKRERKLLERFMEENDSEHSDDGVDVSGMSMVDWVRYNRS